MAAADLQQRVIDAYVTPGHPTAFSTPQRVSKHFNISLSKAKEILEHVEGYTLHREYKQPNFYNPYYVHGRREQVQGDLIDVSRISRENEGNTFLLVLIDIFTKKLWVYPIKRKDRINMTAAMTLWLNAIDRPPRKLMTDRGLEFTNRPVQALLRSHNVLWQPANGTLKACIAERVNKTLQILIYKYLTENETIKYIDVLAQLVVTYNERGHRTLEGMTPAQADLPTNEARVRAIFHEKYEDANKHRKTTLPFKVGDMVRLKTEAHKISSSSRAYAEQFHGEYYRIMRINRTMPVAVYYLRSLDTGELIEGGLYANELQRQRGDLYKIETVLDRRGRGRRRELLVKWRYFGPRWNEWILASNVGRVY
jgi:hypothetical protein